MIEVSSSKNNAKIIQDIYENFNCHKSLAADIEL